MDVVCVQQLSRAEWIAVTVSMRRVPDVVAGEPPSDMDAVTMAW